MITKVVGKQEVLGIGKPDFSRTVSSALERAGLRLKANQQLKMYGRSLNLGDAEYEVPSTPLAPGANTHFTDFETLTPMPITIPAGFILSLVSVGYTVSQDAYIYAYLDEGVHIECMGAIEGGTGVYINKVVGWTTAWIPPPGAVSHPFDIKLYNIGTENLFGQVVAVFILEAVGTPAFPTTKECTCPHCGNKQVESVHATRIKCKNCGHEYGVYDLTAFRGTQ